MVLLCIPLFRLNGGQVRQMFSETGGRIARPFIALFGALVMVNLLMQGGDNAPVILIGKALAALTGELATVLFVPRRVGIVLLRFQYRFEPDVRRHSAIDRPEQWP